MIDSHCHLDGEEFAEDLREVIQRAQEAGVTKVLVPAIDLKSCHSVMKLCEIYPDFCFPMLGLHPEEVRQDWQEVLPGDPGLIVGSARSPGEGNGNPVQYSSLDNFMDRGAWWAIVHEVTKSQTGLKD